MFEIQRVTDYGAYSYDHETGGKNKNRGVDFGDIMTGSGEMSEMHEPAYVHFERDFEMLAAPSIDVITYNHGGNTLLINSFIGINLDITV